MTILTSEEIAKLRDLDYESEQLAKVLEKYTKDRRPKNSFEFEEYANAFDALRADQEEWRTIMTNAVRRWQGWKGYEQRKAEREAARRA